MKYIFYGKPGHMTGLPQMGNAIKVVISQNYSKINLFSHSEVVNSTLLT